MTDFNDLSSLFNYIQQKANSALKYEGAKAVVNTMQEEIKNTVYPVYDPVMYERSYYNDGLLDPDNINIEVVSDNTISVENIRSDGNKNVAEIVETGLGYNYPVPQELSDGRPFTENTRERLKNSDILQQAMKDGLNRLGIDARK